MTERRRFRGTVQNPVTPGWRVEESSRDRAKTIAAAAGVSPSEFIDALIQNVELDDRGLPVWWVPRSPHEELPITPT